MSQCTFNESDVAKIHDKYYRIAIPNKKGSTRTWG